MKQKLFANCGLLLIENEGRSRLYKVPQQVENCAFELTPMQFLSEPQASIDVYPECNLIVTPDALFTLDERLVLSREHGNIEIVPADKNWLIIQSYPQENDCHFHVLFWNGREITDEYKGQKLVRNDRFLALYTKKGKFWKAYSNNGELLLQTEKESANIELCGHFMVTNAVGNHTVYSLKSRNCLFTNQQLILCSFYSDFVVCANLQGEVQTYYNGKTTQLGKAEYVEIFDRAGLFCLQQKDGYFLYRFSGDDYASYSYEGVAYDAENNSLLLNSDGKYHFVSCI